MTDRSKRAIALLFSLAFAFIFCEAIFCFAYFMNLWDSGLKEATVVQSAALVNHGQRVYVRPEQLAFYQMLLKTMMFGIPSVILSGFILNYADIFPPERQSADIPAVTRETPQWVGKIFRQRQRKMAGYLVLYVLSMVSAPMVAPQVGDKLYLGYLIGLLIFVGLQIRALWRCPACQRDLGRQMNIQACPHCQADFH